MEGATHYLLIKMGMGEDFYRRFYYRDIESASLQRSWRKVVGLGILTGLLALPTIGFWIGMRTSQDASLIAFVILFGLPTVTSLILFLVAWAQGGSGKLNIRTHVTEEQIASMSWRKARRIMATLQTKIANSQAPLTPEAFDHQLANHRNRYFNQSSSTR